MATEEEERIEAGLDLTGEERSEARATVRHVSDPARQRRLYAQAYARLRESKRRDLVVDLRAAEEDNAEREAQAQPKEFPPVLVVAPVKPAEPDRPLLTVTRRGRFLRVACGGLVAFVDPLEIASVNSTSHSPAVASISVRGGLVIHVPLHTADEVFGALDDGAP